MRAAILGLIIGAYLGAGLYSGLLMQRAIPALNPFGVAWIAATWPNVIRCARVDAECNPTGPEWLKPYLFSIPTEGEA